MKTVGILCGGGDAPGLNAVIRAVVKYGAGQLGWQLIGIEDSFNGVFEHPFRIQVLTPVSCRGLLQRGGTILGTTNHGDPFHYEGGHDYSLNVVRGLEQLGIEGLIVIGGDGTMAICQELIERHGLKIVGVPKTIDNDLYATDVTFGFQSAVDCATDALDRLHTTAASHDRVQVLEVMGRDTGWIALHAGMSGGADVVIVPEIPWEAERVVRKIEERKAIGRPFSIVIVAEGAVPTGEALVPGKAGQRVVEAIERLSPGAEVRLTVLGHLQRGGSPVAFDRLLATRLGVGAVDLVQAGRWGEMSRLKNGRIDGVPIREAISMLRRISPDDELVRAARATGIEFGG